MVVKFDYEYKGSCPLGEVYRPVAKVAFESPKDQKIINLWMIVDTGSDLSILPNHFATDFGISLDNECWQDSTSGVGGKQTIYLYKKRLVVKIDRVEMKIPIAFFDNDEVPPLMGRLGFLETFDTEFLKSRTVVFKP